MPWARVKGLARTNQAAEAGSRPARPAIVGTVRASASRPATASSRKPSSPNHGFIETCATSPPHNIGSGP